MRDRYFYPLVLVIAILMVGAAYFAGGNQPQCGPFGGADGPEDYSFATIKGQDLCRMEGAEGFDLELTQDVLTIQAEADALRMLVEQNAHFKLGGDLETVYAGQRLQVSITAKPADKAGAMAFEFNYSTGKAGDTGWTRIDLRPGWNTYTAEINIPRKLLENAVDIDYFSIRPVVPEKTRGLEIREIEFRRKGRWGES